MAAFLFLALLGAAVVGGCSNSTPPAAAQPSQSSARCPNDLTSGLSGGSGAFHAPHFVSDYVSAPVTGAQDVPNAVFTNIFLYPAPSTESWDQHLASLAKSTSGVDPAATAGSLNSITRALVCSSYFDLLTQYNINPPTFAGSEATVQSCVDEAVKDAGSNKGLISFATMRSFASCERSHSDLHSDQVNIFVSPDLKAAEYDSSVDMCAPPSTSNGYHGFGVNVPNWTVIPTHTGCNAGMKNVTEDLSHEMVELVSDPAGLGWIHESLPGRFITPELGADLEEQYSEGELGDICSQVGLFPTPTTPFSDDSLSGLGPVEVAPYWSDQDGACEPRAVADHTLLTLTGQPFFRFGGSNHHLLLPIARPAGIAGHTITALELMVITGSDNLDGGAAANVTAQFSTGPSITTSAINEGTEWGNNTAHAVLLQFPHGMQIGQLSSLTLDVSGDEWNVNAVVVKVAVGDQPACLPTSVPVVNDNNVVILNDGSLGLVRMTGSTHTFSVPMAASVGARGLVVNDLILTVGTGKDDLNGGPSPSDNADAVITLSSGASVSFPNINQSSNWPNSSTRTVDLFSLNSIPAGTTIDQLTTLTLTTAFGGGLSGENWDVSSLSLTAVLGCVGRTTQLKPITLVLLQVNGASVLGDGSIGLARLTGDVHRWGPTPVFALPPSEASLRVVSLQITITTGADDLNGGSNGSDNATVDIGGVGLSFPNVNQRQSWGNHSVHTVNLTPLPATVFLGNVSTVTISTMFGGGINGDNWDIAAVELDATVLGPP